MAAEIDELAATWTIRTVLISAWEKQKGAKRTILLSGLIYLVISFLLESMIRLWLGEPVGVIQTPAEDFSWQVEWIGIASSLLLAPLFYGIFYLGIRRSAGETLSVGMIFEPFKLFLKLNGVTLLAGFAVGIGFLLLVLPGIYLILACYFAPYLILKKDVSIWQSLEKSQKAVNKYWWRFFGLTSFLTLLNFLGAILLFLPLIWTIPISLIAIGDVYNASFGDSEQSAVDQPLQ